MNFLKQISVIAALLYSTNIVGQGLLYDESIKKQFEQGTVISPTRDILPIRSSVKKHTPYVHLQLGSECVAYSLATARTVLWAANKGITDIKVITANSFSPFFIYYRNKSSDDYDCMNGLNAVVAAKDLLDNGVPRLFKVECPDYWPCTGEKRLCNWYPPLYSDDLKNSSRYRLDNIYNVTSTDELKFAISEGMPVVVGMMVPESFQKQVGTLWTPASSESINSGYGHAMVVVGYDDTKYGGAFEIMNSWGTKWGNSGFIWIRYDDLVNFTVLAMALHRLSEGGLYGSADSDKLPAGQGLDGSSALEKDVQLGVNPKWETSDSTYLMINNKTDLLLQEEE